MRQLPDAPWIREAERLGYPVGGERVPELYWSGMERSRNRQTRFFRKTAPINGEHKPEE